MGNPLYKMDSTYRFFYAIAASSQKSKWFDQVIKVDVSTRSVVATWTSPGTFMTEFDFVPHTSGSGSSSEEDDGLLVGVLYNTTEESSSVAILNAKDLKLQNLYKLPFVVPFHAHGIV